MHDQWVVDDLVGQPMSEPMLPRPCRAGGSRWREIASGNASGTFSAKGCCLWPRVHKLLCLPGRHRASPRPCYQDHAGIAARPLKPLATLPRPCWGHVVGGNRDAALLRPRPALPALPSRARPGLAWPRRAPHCLAPPCQPCIAQLGHAKPGQASPGHALPMPPQY